MKHLFRSLCLSLSFLCGAVGLHANALPASEYAVSPAEENLWVPQETEEPTMEQEIVIAKASSKTYPLVYHELNEVFHGCRVQMLHGDSVLLEDAPHLRFTDQSVWQVDKEDAAKLATWRPGHVLSIQPNRSWFHNKKFSCVVHNLNTEDKVAVKSRIYCDRLMHTMPVIERSIPSEQCIILEHGTRWFIPSSSCRRVFEEWHEGDVIMIGINEDWFGAHNFLINLSKHDYCHASWIR